MPRWSLYYHFVWTTKYRAPTLDEAWETSFFPIMIHKFEGFGGTVFAIGGVQDHIHVVASVPPKETLSYVVGQAKGASSHFINSKLQPPFQFAWQSEYAVVSFSERQLKWVAAYVRSQKHHHSFASLHPALEAIEEDHD